MRLYEYCAMRAKGRMMPGSRRNALERMVAQSDEMAAMSAAQIVERVVCRYGRRGWEYKALIRLVNGYKVHCRRHGVAHEEVSLARNDDDGRIRANMELRRAAGIPPQRKRHGKLVWVLLIGALLTGCRTTKVVTVERVHRDTVRISQQQRDSIWLHDSVYLHEYQRGETLCVERTKWQVKYVERVRVDTVYKVRVDSVPVVQVVEVVKKETWWQRMKRKAATMGLIVCVVAAAAMWVKMRR